MTPRREIIAAVAALPDAAMRRVVLVERLRHMVLGDAAVLLEEIIRGALYREPMDVRVYRVLVRAQAMQRDLGLGACESMLAVAQEKRLGALVLWLRSPFMPQPLEHVDTDRLVAQDLQHMTLGERRALARRAPASQLDRLVADPDFGVIRNLLNNPRMTEAWVLRICARRPAVSRALEEVLESPKWAERPAVHRALVRNPYFNQTLALNLLPLLGLAEVRELANEETSSRELRYAAQILAGLGPTLDGHPDLAVH